jgi:hypothetical protein
VEGRGEQPEALVHRDEAALGDDLPVEVVDALARDDEPLRGRRRRWKTRSRPRRQAARSRPSETRKFSDEGCEASSAARCTIAVVSASAARTAATVAASPGRAWARSLVRNR